MKIIRSIPNENKFFVEETSENGNVRKSIERGVINVFDEFKYQEILGFGGAFTEAAA